MLSFQELYTRCQNMFSDTTSATKTIIQDVLNDAYKEAIVLTGTRDDGEYVIISIADEYSYNLPADTDKIRSVRTIMTDTSGTTTSTSAGNLVDSSATFTVNMIGKWVYNTTDNTFTKITGRNSATSLAVEDDIFTTTEAYQIGNGNEYVAEEIASEHEWNLLIQANIDVSSDVLRHYFLRNKKLEIYPRADTASNLILVTYSKLIGDMSADDYTTGTVTINKGSTTVTGSGTTYTAAMIGRFIKSAANDVWHRIKTFTSTTVVVLETYWQNPTASAGASYTIGEMPLIPERFHRALTYPVIAELYLKREQPSLADRWENKWERAKQDMRKYGSSKSENITVRLNKSQKMIPNTLLDKTITDI